MSANIYSSPAHFTREQKTLFRRNWVCAGFGHQVPNPGDIAPVAVGGLPLILVRGEDTEVRVFHNVCRHRGSRLFSSSCAGTRVIRCPYHSWTYELDGRLRRRPHFEGPEQHTEEGEGLWTVKSAMWCDLVFVDIDDAAGDFETFIGPLRALGEAYGIDSARFDEVVEIEIAANWKLLVENFVDGYHVSSVHPELEKSVPTRTHRFRQEGSLFIGEAPTCQRSHGKEGGSYVAGLPKFAGVTSSVENTLTYMSVFPNLCINLMADRFSVYHMQPLQADLSLESIHNYYAPAAFSDTTEDLRRTMTRNQLAFNAEDIDALLRLQAGRSSDIYDAGRPSPYWDANAEAFLEMCIAGTT